ncbi:unnamed protein product [Callosobruchus maculatus]|uniref:Reverse transcriptase domain-containing protein n=1 Tax=Callosobruchus maculatus TaxID=64391 RepID=A0A653DX41_CALMS|nr:unnamed protein product [Callosobruchus maculatus]
MVYLTPIIPLFSRSGLEGFIGWQISQAQTGFVKGRGTRERVWSNSNQKRSSSGMQQHSASYGLGTNYNRTKVIIVDREHDNHQEIKSIGRCKVLQSFVYLGSLIDNSGSCANEIRRGIQQARVAMTKLTKISHDHNIAKATKMSLLQSLVFSIFLYASETWSVKKADRARIDAFEMWT